MTDSKKLRFSFSQKFQELVLGLLGLNEFQNSLLNPMEKIKCQQNEIHLAENSLTHAAIIANINGHYDLQDSRV